jgi:toxin ParE1/3/4
VARDVVFAPEAEQDILELYDYIAVHSGAARAQAYTERIVDYCLGFAIFPERGRRRDDLRPGLRVTGFERRVVIAFHVTAETVVIDRVFYGGRDLAGAMGEEW